MLAAFCRAMRTTLAVTQDPGLDHVLGLFLQGVEPEVLLQLPDLLDDAHRAFAPGIVRNLAQGLFQGAPDDGDADLQVAFDLSLSRVLWQRRSRATPPPGTMPSSTAARVADRASSTRSFFSLSSTSVGRRP